MLKTRIVLTFASLLLVVTLGLTNPGPVATVTSRVVVAAFSFSMAFALVTVLAMVPVAAERRTRRPRDPESGQGAPPQRTAAR